MTQNVLVKSFEGSAALPVVPSWRFPVRPTPSYQDVLRDLQYATQAGDVVFAPALKLLLDEAVQLAAEGHKMSAQAYQIRVMAVKVAYQSLLEMETTHAVAKQIQMRQRKLYRDEFWDFLPQAKEFARASDPRILCSDGNVDKALYFAVKRLVDIVVAALLLIAFSPVMLLIAFMIKRDSQGPVIFSQERVGAHQRVRAGVVTWEVRNFRFYKFRSMYRDVDQTLHKEYIERWVQGQAEDSGDKKARFKLSNDPRITPIGHFLRKASLDELPQLFNVLKGDMSLVGPRPVPLYEVNLYQDEHYERLASMPGITGLWQVEGRGHVGFEEQVRLDIQYIYHQSFWYDLKLMFLTIPAVLSARGAK